LRTVLPEEAAVRLVIVNISDVYEGSESRLIKEADLWRDEVHYSELYLPYRSLLLLSTGSAFAQSHGHKQVYAGFINSNHAQEIDCSTEFFLKLADLFTDYGGVQIEMPFRTWSKYDVALEGLRLGAPIATTFSCQVSAEVPCGACPNCVDRLGALKAIIDGGTQ
jgi:7-cyano-7-deazaguanine synthase